MGLLRRLFFWDKEGKNLKFVSGNISTWTKMSGFSTDILYELNTLCVFEVYTQLFVLLDA